MTACQDDMYERGVYDSSWTRTLTFLAAFSSFSKFLIRAVEVAFAREGLAALVDCELRVVNHVFDPACQFET
jgi:hypothetical protein